MRFVCKGIVICLYYKTVGFYLLLADVLLCVYVRYTRILQIFFNVLSLSATAIKTLTMFKLLQMWMDILGILEIFILSY